MAANMIIASVSNRATHCKLILFNNRMRFCIEDLTGGKFQSFLNVGVEMDFVTKLVRTLKEARKAAPGSALNFSWSSNNDNVTTVEFNITVSSNQNGVMMMNINCPKGNYDFPFLSIYSLGVGASPLPEKERSEIKVETYINMLMTAHQTMTAVKLEQYRKAREADERAQQEQGGEQGGGGGNPQYQKPKQFGNNNYQKPYQQRQFNKY